MERRKGRRWWPREWIVEARERDLEEVKNAGG
jgi:hypothetical protein